LNLHTRVSVVGHRESATPVPAPVGDDSAASTTTSAARRRRIKRGAAQARPPAVVVNKIDVDQFEGIWKRFNFRGIPAMLMFKDGPVQMRRTRRVETATSLIPVSPRRLGAICSRTGAVPGPYWQRPDLVSCRRYVAIHLIVSPGRARAE